MEGKKMAPPPHQHQMRQQQQIQGDPRQTQPPPNYPHIHQPQYDAPPRPQQPLGPRSPLLENHQDLYGTRQSTDAMRQSAEMTRQTLEMARLQAEIARQPTELSRQYALREQNAQIAAAQRAAELQQRSIPVANSSYSMHSPTQDPILTAAVPPGYNASVHQAYLRRNRHLTDQQQIYQNHQSVYRPPPPQQNRTYQPYTSRIQQPNYVQSPGHSHTQLLRQQYNELQQMKLHQQMQYQSQAQLQQQQTFAQRQILHQHLHSRQQSQQNLTQYGNPPTTAQINEVNSRLTQKQDTNASPQDEYSLHPLKNSQNQHKQNAQSPSVHLGSSPISKNSCDVASSPSTKSPSGSESRRSSSGTGQALRSPIAQRPLSAPVTKAGWLYKQGSDGLKVWRKRWFVLSEYCLFYYKGQEEDKLLGSVLLPSYQVSLCSLDDKVLKKYSFKCEHANMRTYILAAPDQEQMMHWMKVLTMAALMQEGGGNSEKQKLSVVNAVPNNTEKRSKTPVNVGEQDEITAEISGGIQPTYENAPPKPRRSNEGYNSPSPERSMERYDPNYDILRDPSAYKNSENAQQKIQVKNRINAKSPQPSGTEALYESKSVPNTSNYATQRHITKSPEVIYNAHNLSLPLTNTATNRLENNKSPMIYQDSRTIHNNVENRLTHNKSPAYFDNRNPTENTPRQGYQIDNQNVYGETGYQKMLNQQEMNKRIAEQYPQDHTPSNSQIYQQHPSNSNQMSGNPERQSFERRTPDTYGRSVIVPGYYSKGRSGDYEDVYNNPQPGSEAQAYAESYRRPLSPMAYEEQKLNAMQMQHQQYTSNNLDNNQMYQAPPVQMRQKKLPHNYAAPILPHNNSVPRPHSADFLEYEAKNPSYDPNISTRQSIQSSRQPPRPKSSLDINKYNEYNGDSYYYSEASYAEKMRQSAHYLRSKNFGSTNINPRIIDPKSPDDFIPNQRKLSMPTFRGNDPNMESNNYDSDLRIDGEAIYGIRDQNRNVSADGKYGQSEITGPNSNWTLRNKSLTHLMGQEELYNRSNSAMSEGSTVSGFNRDPAQMGLNNGEQFIRSASARLPSTTSDHQIHSSRDGERKVQQREESMKRLLEWKQRMLQSPLTRKSTPAALSLARSLNRHVAKPTSRTPLTGSASQTFPRLAGQAAYNSYSSDDEASMSASMSGMDNLNRSLGKKPLVGGNSSCQRPGGRDPSIPIRAVSPRVREQPYGMQSGHDSDLWNGQSMQQLMVEDNWTTMRSPSRQSNHQPVRAVSPRVRRSSEVDDRPNAPLANPASQDPSLGVNNLSAGQLLGRTHEELVLLLIQLRRKHSATAVAIEQCCTQIHSVQSRISTDNSPEHRQENLQRLEQLRHHLADLERQYEKGRPLVHLVDNMVKLGTLYQRGGSVPATLDRLEHNQRQRERLLLEQAMEQRRWVESSECLPREQAEQKVEQLRALERLVAGEAGAVRGLRRDRDSLQRALGGAHLQHDLSRVHAMLAVNSKKLEQTVAGNARLEQELTVLRQKLQGQQYQESGASGYGSQSMSGSLHEIGPDGRTAADTTAMLEDELRRVQQLVGDLQTQRVELGAAVRHITHKSQTLGLVPPPLPPPPTNMYQHQSLNSSSVDLNNPKKSRLHSGWQETDLDSGSLVDHGSGSMVGMAPLYIDTAVNDSNGGGHNSPLASDETGQNGGFGNLTNVEKQEIKTVRIVKRESERRQRDRERSLQPGHPDWSSQHPAKALDHLMEEDSAMSYQQSRGTSSLPRGFQPNPPQYSSYNSTYQPESVHSNSRAYSSYQKDNNQLNSALYQPRSHANPPNTLSLTNVNIPFDNMSISSANSSNKFVSSPSLVNNNDYLNNHHDALQISGSRYGSYQSSSQILPLPTTNSYSMPKHSMSQSVPFLDSPVEVHRPLTNGPISPGLSKNGSISSLTKVNAELSPVFTSEAARQIIIEMAGEKNGVIKSNGSQHRRQVPKEKRRHYTAPHHLSAKALDRSSAENDIFYEEKWWRARDDVDMERVLRASTRVGGPPPLVAPPDVVRSTLPTNATADHYSEQTIDRLLAAPNKILIPERYIPEQLPELSPEEQKKRLEKVESIKKMLSSTTPSSDPSKSPDGEDKRQREHLLQLNQILAKQVMEMSKIVAGTGPEAGQQSPSPNSVNSQKS